MQKHKKGLILAVDFDGTIVKHDFPRIGDDIGAIPWLVKWQEAGALIILYTMRSGEYLQKAIEHLEENGIELYGVNHNPDQSAWTQSQKVYANLYVDDAGYCMPLVKPFAQRPYVDWETVGPGVLEIIEANEQEEIILPGDHRLN